jgi:hypothetical protein
MGIDRDLLSTASGANAEGKTAGSSRKLPRHQPVNIGPPWPGYQNDRYGRTHGVLQHIRDDQANKRMAMLVDNCTHT